MPIAKFSATNVTIAGGSVQIDPVPTDQVVWVEDRFLNGSAFEMSVDGSSTTQNFVFGPPSGQVWYVEKVSLLIQDPGTIDVDDFGAITSGLTNGVQLLQDISSTEYELLNMKDNGAVALFFAQHAVLPGGGGESGAGWLDEDDTFTGVKEFPVNIKLNGTNGDQLIFRIRDDVTAVAFLQASARAWRVI